LVNVVNCAVQAGDSLVQELPKLDFGHTVEVVFKEQKIRLPKLLGQAYCNEMADRVLKAR
jgi:hypothetical protein